MSAKKKILLLATGGTIASKKSENGLKPQITPEELLEYIPQVKEFCEVSAIQLLNLDSSNMEPEHWKKIVHAIREYYDAYDGFVIAHGTDTMAYTAAALSYMVQNSTNPIVIALLIDLILLFLGCIMDMAPIILIATPILLPIATSIGIDPVQFGIIMVLNCGIGLLTPPVGSVLFIGSAVSGVKMERVVKATLPFYICMIIVLMLLTFIPEVSLLLPRVFGGYGG